MVPIYDFVAAHKRHVPSEQDNPTSFSYETNKLKKILYKIQQIFKVIFSVPVMSSYEETCPLICISYWPTSGIFSNIVEVEGHFFFKELLDVYNLMLFFIDNPDFFQSIICVLLFRLDNM